MTKQALLDLAARVEAATADTQMVHICAAHERIFGQIDDPIIKMLDAQAFLDAAMTLVPEGWSALVRIGKRNMAWVEGEYGSVEDGSDTHHEIKAVSATPALALTAAALRARAATL